MTVFNKNKNCLPTDFRWEALLLQGAFLVALLQLLLVVLQGIKLIVSALAVQELLVISLF